MVNQNVISFVVARDQLKGAGEHPKPRQWTWLQRQKKPVLDALILTAVIVIPSITITALFLGAGWAMWLHHAWLAAQLGSYGVFWAWGGYALTTGAAYAWVMRRFPPAIVAAWAYVLFMVGVEGWAHVSFGPVALTAAAGVALLKAGGR